MKQKKFSALFLELDKASKQNNDSIINLNNSLSKKMLRGGYETNNQT